MLDNTLYLPLSVACTGVHVESRYSEGGQQTSQPGQPERRPSALRDAAIHPQRWYVRLRGI